MKRGNDRLRLRFNGNQPRIYRSTKAAMHLSVIARNATREMAFHWYSNYFSFLSFCKIDTAM